MVPVEHKLTHRRQAMLRQSHPRSMVETSQDEVTQPCNDWTSPSSYVYSDDFSVSFLSLFLFICLFVHLPMLGLCCCMGFSLVAASGGFCLAAACGLLIAVVSLVLEHRPQGTWASVVVHMGSVFATTRLKSTGSIAVAHRLSCSSAYGIFLDQGSNPRLPHWQVDSLPLDHQGSCLFPKVKIFLAIWAENVLKNTYSCFDSELPKALWNVCSCYFFISDYCL